MAADLGIVLKVRLHVDAAAALGIIERRGVGRMRHLDFGTLWLQEQQLRDIVELKKVPGLENPGDLLSKNLSQERIDHYSELIGYAYVSGRAELTSGLHSIGPRVIGPSSYVPAFQMSDRLRAESSDHVSQSRVDRSSRRKEGRELSESRKWDCLSLLHWRGGFKNARAYRSPTCAGVE